MQSDIDRLRNDLRRKGGISVKKPVRARVPVSSNGTAHSHAHHHLLAHAAPFSGAATGAKQLSQFPQHSTTYDSTTLVDTTTNASGVFSMAITTHPLFTLYLPASGGTITGASSNGFVAGGSGWSSYAGIDQPSLTGLCERYRVVSIGLRFKPTTTFSNTTGHGYIATFPAPEQLPFAMVSGTTASVLADNLGVPYDSGTGTISNALANYPGSKLFTFAELLADGGVQVNIGPCGPRHEDWLSPSPENGKQGLAICGASLTAYAGNVDLSYSSGAGWEMAVLRFVGCPASTMIGTLQIKYHLEVVPKLGANGANAPMPTGLPPPVTASPDLKHKVFQEIRSLPRVETVREAMKREKEVVVKLGGEKMKRLLPSTKNLAEKAMGLALI